MSDGTRARPPTIETIRNAGTQEPELQELPGLGEDYHDLAVILRCNPGTVGASSGRI